MPAQQPAGPPAVVVEKKYSCTSDELDTVGGAKITWYEKNEEFFVTHSVQVDESS